MTFELAVDGELETSEFTDFFENELGNFYSTVEKLKGAIDAIVVKKKTFAKVDFTDKIISFIYSHLIKFERTNKINGIPMSKIFIEKLKGIMDNKIHIHHSHINGQIIGYAHSYCNQRVRENKSKVSVIVHNLFRFGFFFLLKGITSGVWRTRHISIGEKNPTNINFATKGNQVMFTYIFNKV